jgi:acyl carrier protein
MPKGIYSRQIAGEPAMGEKLMDAKTQVREYIVENFLFGDEEPLTSDSMSLLDGGIIDSVGVMELVAFLEQDFEIAVADDDLVPENLDSVDNLVSYITRKKQVA